MKRDTKQRRNEGKLMTQNRAELNRNLAQMLKGGVIMDVTTPEQAKKMADLSDGAIVGSAIVKLLAQYGKDAPEHIGAYVKEMKDALR